MPLSRFMPWDRGSARGWALSELMPTRIRSNGMSIALVSSTSSSRPRWRASFCLWWANTAIRRVLPVLRITVVYLLTVAFFLPETKGKDPRRDREILRKRLDPGCSLGFRGLLKDSDQKCLVTGRFSSRGNETRNKGVLEEGKNSVVRITLEQQRFTRALQSRQLCFVTGHDFSRANKANQMNGL